MKIESQEKIWDAIAEPWEEFRLKPVEEAVNFLKDKKGKILDLCCGSGKHFPWINGEIYGVDFSENMLRNAEKLSEKNNLKANLTKTEAYDLPFEDNFFDAVIFVAGLHCIETQEKREKTLKELLRVMKPNAEALITVWDYDQEKFKNTEKESLIPWKYRDVRYMRYYYLYDKNEIIKLLKKIGFEVVKIFDKENLDSFYSRKNIIVIVRKPISS